MAIFITSISCAGPRHSKQGVEAAMKQYDHLILTLDAGAIASLYMPNGHLGDIAIGRDSIKRFLSSFKNVRVLSQSSTTTSVKINRDTAIQKGTYQQADIIGEKDTVRVKGEYITTWVWLWRKGWFIDRMMTKPIN